jgi:hypothetical protein
MRMIKNFFLLLLYIIVISIHTQTVLALPPPQDNADPRSEMWLR